MKFLITFHLKSYSVLEISLILISDHFSSNYDESEEEILLTQNSSPWGSGLWGMMPWGGGTDSYGYTTWVPMNKQYCSRLNVGVRHKKALEKVSICGVAFDFEVCSDRIGR